MKTSSKQTNGYSAGNAATLVRGGRPYFDLLEQLVDGAREVVLFQTYIFENDLTGKRISAAFTRAALRGVKVYVLIDGYASQDLEDETIITWRQSGVFFRWFEPMLRSRQFYVGRRLHHKVLAVDGYHGLVGGINISDRYNDIGDHVAWLDWAVHVEGEAAKMLHEICGRRAKSRYSRRQIQVPLPQSIPPNPVTVCPVRVRVNDWVRGKMEISRGYIEMMRHAESEVIMMSSYFLPGPDLRRQMRRAAGRGITIRVILAGPSDVRLAKLAERYLYPWLMKIGVEIYEYQRSVLHGKMTVCDRQWVTIGSYNLNELSARASVELNVEVNQEAFALEVYNNLSQIILHDCLRISPQNDRHAGFFNRMVQGTAYQMLRFILFLFTFYFKQRKT